MIVTPAPSPDVLSQSNRQQVPRKNKTQLDNDRRELRNRQLEDENRLRLMVARRVFVVVISWMVAVLLILTGHAVSARLSDPVLIALLATTTVNVIGLFSAVVVYLFPSRPPVPPGRPRRR